MDIAGTNGTLKDIGVLILRVTLGVLILLHGVHKLLNGIGGVEAAVQNAGLPWIVGYAVFIGEVIGPILLIIGWYARIGAILIAINMAFAFALVHIPANEFFQLTGQGSWMLELQGMYIITAIALALLGPGRFSINRR